jgi:hypothetical protein
VTSKPSQVQAIVPWEQRTVNEIPSLLGGDEGESESASDNDERRKVPPPGDLSVIGLYSAVWRAQQGVYVLRSRGYCINIDFLAASANATLSVALSTRRSAFNEYACTYSPLTS